MAVPANPTHPADRLIAAIERARAPVCVGIDPVLERLPFPLQTEAAAGFAAEAGCIVHFCIGVLNAIAAHVPCVKIQSACFERLGTDHAHAIHEVLGHAKQCGLEVILDAKRGDIGISAEHYAAAAFQDSLSHGAAADWLTINSYLGEDGITPFLHHRSHGAFALVRTSNPSGDAIQELQLQDGRNVAEAVADLVAEIGRQHIGVSGFSALGAVVGATKPEAADRLRRRMPQQIFLVPGFGAQGGGIQDVLPCFDGDGRGAVITASRSVIYAFKQDDGNWSQAIADAAARFADEVGRAVGMR